MNPYHFKGQSRILEAPHSYDHKAHGECGGLPVRFVDGGCLSVWKPSANELATLNADGGVVLFVLGLQPVTSMGVCEAEQILVEA